MPMFSSSSQAALFTRPFYGLIANPNRLVSSTSSILRSRLHSTSHSRMLHVMSNTTVPHIFRAVSVASIGLGAFAFVPMAHCDSKSLRGRIIKPAVDLILQRLYPRPHPLRMALRKMFLPQSPLCRSMSSRLALRLESALVFSSKKVRKR